MPQITQRDECEAVVRTRGWLARQPEAFQSALLKRAKLRAVAAEETVHLPGADPGGMFGVVSGSFRAHVPGRGSNYVLAHILRAGLWFGHGPLNTGRTRTMGFVASEPSIAFHIPLTPLAQLASSDVVAARCLASLTEYSMDITIATVADLLISASDKRIASVLLRVTGAADADPKEPRVAYRLTQAQLGEMANASRDLVNRTLRGFEANGWLTLGYNHVVIVDAAALSQFASE
jgi:CRP-like cAMP-binding protein